MKFNICRIDFNIVSQLISMTFSALIFASVLDAIIHGICTRQAQNSSPNRSQINKNLILGRKSSFYKLHWRTLASILAAVAALLALFGWF